MITNSTFSFGDKTIKERNTTTVFYDRLKVIINSSFVIMDTWINGVSVAFLLDTSSSMIGEGFDQMKKVFLSIIQGNFRLATFTNVQLHHTSTLTLIFIYELCSNIVILTKT